MTKIYGVFEYKGNLYLETFADYDVETERFECTECVYDIDEYDVVSNIERKFSFHEYNTFRDPFDLDAKYDNILVE